VERLVADVDRRHVPAGAAVVTEGEVGDEYYVIDRGDVDVLVDDTWVRTLGPGRGFGEIALVRDLPRTATVRAATDVELVVFDRDRFLQAVTGHAPSASVGDARADHYLEP
jgi:CRP-like cAMP-binding protein